MSFYEPPKPWRLCITLTNIDFIGKHEETNKLKIFQHFCDNLSEIDIREAKIVLFTGKAGKGKTSQSMLLLI